MKQTDDEISRQQGLSFALRDVLMKMLEVICKNVEVVKHRSTSVRQTLERMEGLRMTTYKD